MSEVRNTRYEEKGNKEDEVRDIEYKFKKDGTVWAKKGWAQQELEQNPSSIFLTIFT